MTKIKNWIFGIGNTVTNTINYFTRESFDISDDWFNELYNKHYTKDISSKYIPELFESQLPINLYYNTNVLFERINKRLDVSISNLERYLNYFEEKYKELIRSSLEYKFQLNQDRDQVIKIESLKSRLKTIHDFLEEFKIILKNEDYDSLFNFEELDISEINYNWDLDSNPLSNMNVFKVEPPNEGLILRDTLGIIDNLLHSIPNIGTPISHINIIISSVKKNNFIIHGNAGFGKSNLSAHLTNDIRKSNSYVIFLQAKSFSGESTNFNQIFLDQLIIPNGYNVSEILKKINLFGKSKKEKVTIIIDGLNETTFTNNGFSQIWKLHLDNLINSIKSHNYLNILVTLRTSYIERIWSHSVPGNLLKLDGFDEGNLESTVEKYFKYYKIKTNEKLTADDIFYFRTPLLLDLYCKMLNHTREKEVTPLLGIGGYTQVFEKYIIDLAQKIKLDLNLASTEVILNGIQRCSNAFLNKLQAQLTLAEYYSLSENKPIEEINVNYSFSHSILEEYLIYIRDAVPSLVEDVVLHTQQEVGGYLLAKELIRTHTTIENVVKSDFYQNHLIGNELHQLKDDILNFLITFSIDTNDFITKYSLDKELKTQLWKKLQVEPASEINNKFRDDLLNNIEYQSEFSVFLYNSRSSFLLENSSINFLPTIPFLKDLKGMSFDMTWTKFIYENWFNWDNYLGKFNDDIIKLNPEVAISKKDILRLELAVWLLETTIRELRDKATAVLLEFATKYPQYIFDKVYEFSTENKIYIYERIVSVCYGVCLRKQNDDHFINGVFKDQFPSIYNLQFGQNPIAPNYNYIVIDCLKHLVDLAILKNVFQLNAKGLELLKNYKFRPTEEWIEPDGYDINAVLSISNQWTLDSKPDPLRGDFVHYTIPRLTDKNGPVARINATANIYKRIMSLGYVPEEKYESDNKDENSFYYGEKPYGFDSKIDRLGKKYSWMAFFDYAGYLLNKGQLNVWYKRNVDDVLEYNRLGDVDIEITNPKPIIDKIMLFQFNLLSHKINDPKWTVKKLYSESKKIWNHNFEEGNFTLLKGYLEQKPDTSYEVRSFLLIESFLVNLEDIAGQELNIINREHDWHDNLHGEGSSSNVYFGELYWADNISIAEIDYQSITVEGEEEVEHELTLWDFENTTKFKGKNIGDKVMIKVDKRIYFKTEATTMDYLWESKSKVFLSQRGNLPSCRIGRHLELKADPINFQLIDKKGKLAYRTIDYNEEDIIKQELDYLRSDLLNKYMKDKGLVLMYQIKQHTYDRVTGDGSGDFRGMQFFFPHLDKN